MRHFLLLVSFFLLSLSASAKAVKAIAFPLDGVLVQRIPFGNTNFFPANEVVKVEADNNRAFMYHINLGALEVLAKLVNEGYQIHVLTTEDQALAKAIADKLVLPGARQTLGQIAASLNGSEVRKNGKFDLAVIDKNLKNVLFVAPSKTAIEVGQEESYFDLGPFYYAFPDFQRADKNRRPELAAYFPNTDDEWFSEYNKFYWLYAFLTMANQKETKADFTATLNELRKMPRRQAVEVGQQMLRGNFQNQSLRWIYGQDGGRTIVTACESLQTFPQKSLGTGPIDECLHKFPPVYQLKQKAKADFECEKITNDGRAALIDSSKDLSACLDKNPKVRFLFDGANRKICRAYTETLEEIAQVDFNKCSVHFVVFDPANNRGVVLEYKKEMDGLSGQEILRRSQLPAPTQDELLRTWEKKYPHPDDDVVLNKCLSSSYQSMKTDDSRKLLPECEPDTLYSWGPPVKTESFLQAIGNGSWQTQMPRTLFLARSPLSTFGYGPVAVRVKLKKGTKFQSVGFGCAAGDAVGFRNDGRFADWTICSTKVIHSWSFDTKAHWDEIIREYQRHKEIKSRNGTFPGFLDLYASTQASGGIFSTDIDSHSFNESVLLGTLKSFLSRIAANAGKIFYNPDLPAEEKTPAKHFATDHPIYFH